MMSNVIECEITCQVPLDYHNLAGPTIQLFARDLYHAGNEHAEILLFFNGGPGFSCLRAWRDSAWLTEALKTYRVILLDQRGTGRSEPVDAHALAAFTTAAQLADYLAHFRADNIVRDAEWLRTNVLKRTKITLLGQSFGGFIALSYLSFAPNALRGVMITAGIAPLTCVTVDEVYQYLLPTVLERTNRFYQSYPEDKVKVVRIVAALKAQPITVNGEVLTLARFLDLGYYLGQADGADVLHQLLDEAFCADGTVSWRFAAKVLLATNVWELNPLYVLLHESIYCNGDSVSDWAADRVKSTMPGFDLDQAIPAFTGEMVRREMLNDYAGLSVYKEATELLAQKKDWPALYDFTILANNPVPIEVLLMRDDFYVNIAPATAALQKINSTHVWQHKMWQHGALRDHGKIVIKKMASRLEQRITL